MMRSGNPTLNDRVFSDTVSRPDGGAALGTMTINGTVNRTGMLLLILLATASWIWTRAAEGGATGWLIGGAIGGLVLALITIFRKHWAPITAPLYAAFQGVFLGGISATFEVMYPGIVMQAVSLTFGTLFALLMAYRSGWIRATENFKLGIVAATGGVMLVYMASFVLGMFGTQIPMIHDSGIVGIGFSLVVVVIAALNLVLDFDFIENGAAAGAPRYMEWFGAFGLMVTLVWLYLEILHLLVKLQRR